MNWSVPAGAWSGETAFILGGGPSLRGFDAECLKGRGRVIGVNEAGLSLAPWCDVLFWADRRWLQWNVERLHLHTGPLKVTRKRPNMSTGFDIKVLRFMARRLSNDPGAVGGWCGGSSAINLAYLFGARRIVLLGFDMHDLPMDRWQDGNWHRAHVKPPLEGQRTGKFVPILEAMAPELAEAGVQVINATPGSALRCFPFATLDEVLSPAVAA